jgi:ribosomal-protein-alanine N-acetyltransferase
MTGAGSLVTVRDASARDLDPLSLLDAALFGVNAWSRAAMSAELEAAGDTRIMQAAVSDGVLCGYGVLMVIADTADLVRVAVAAEHQRRGIGSRLVEALVGRATSAGCAQMMLEVAWDNAPASALYRRHGFAEIGTRRGYYPDGTDAVVMRLELSRQARAEGRPPQ